MLKFPPFVMCFHLIVGFKFLKKKVHPLISIHVKISTFRNPNELALLAKQTDFWIIKSCVTMTWAFYVSIIFS